MKVPVYQTRKTFDPKTMGVTEELVIVGYEEAEDLVEDAAVEDAPVEEAAAPGPKEGIVAKAKRKRKSKKKNADA